MRAVLVGLGIFVGIALQPRAVHAQQAEGCSVGVAFVRTSAQALLIADSRPQELATMGVAVDAEVPLHGRATLVVTGQVTGTWYDFDNGSSNSGNVKVLVPSVSIGPMVRCRLGDRASLAFGCAFEYSEVRSWSHARVAFLEDDATGPRNFRRGGLFRVAIEGRGGPARPFLALSSGVYEVGASAPLLSASYRWLTPVSSLAMGVRAVL